MVNPTEAKCLCVGPVYIINLHTILHTNIYFVVAVYKLLLLCQNSNAVLASVALTTQSDP